MNICIYTVHLFLYECITCKVKSCLSNYCTFHISYVTTNTQKYKITSMKKMIIDGHPVALVGQAKDFHQHHIWCFSLPCTGENLLEHRTLPCNDQLWCPHMQHSCIQHRHLILCSTIITYFPPPFSKHGIEYAVGNLYIYAPKLYWLQ